MNFGINDMLSALNSLTSSMAGPKGSAGSRAVDHSYITPTIIAVGDFADDKAEDVLSLAQGDPVVVWNLSARQTSNAVRMIFRNQVIDAQWRTPCQYTRAPLLETVFALCFSIKSWYDLDERNLSFIHCPSGKPNSGIVVACFLKYIGAFEHAAHAYDFYCSKRVKTDSAAAFSLASSYRNLFSNVDKAVDGDGYARDGPLHLKTVTVTGLPLEELPALEVWDLNGLAYSSHSGWKVSGSCSWNAEYGDAFFKVGGPVLGDFAVVCSFGGALANKKDKSTLIFKYQNSTAFLAGEVLELRAGDVDVNPDYLPSLDAELFAVHLVFETDPALMPPVNPPALSRLPPYPSMGLAAFERGLDEVSKGHAVMPDPARFRDLTDRGYDDKYIPVALQLGNNDLAAAMALIDRMAARARDLSVAREEDVNNSATHISSGRDSPLAPLDSLSEDSCWEVVDVKCPVCRDDAAGAKADQLVSCSGCGRGYHTHCAGLRRIPFGNTSDKDRASRESYIRRHFGGWRCPACVRHTPEAEETTPSALLGTPTPVPTPRTSSSASSGGTRPSAMSQPASRQSYGLVSGGAVIVTDQLRPLTNATGAPFPSTPAPTPASASASAAAPPAVRRSKQDEVAALVAMLAAEGVTLEDLARTSEEAQRRTVLQVIAAKYPELSLEAPGHQHHQQLDLASALKGILRQLQAQGMGFEGDGDAGSTSTSTSTAEEPSAGTPSAVSSPARYFGKSLLQSARPRGPPGGPGGNPRGEADSAPSASAFDPRAHMLQIIQMRTNIISSSCSTSSGAQEGVGVHPGGAGGASPLRGVAYGSTAVKDLPHLSKYYKMVRAGIPRQAVAKKLLDEGAADSAAMAEYLMTVDPEAAMPADYFQRFAVQLPVGAHPHFEKYFKMLNVGIPIEAVKSKMAAEGLDPAVLDLRPEHLVHYEAMGSSSSGGGGGAGGGGGPGSGTGTGTGPGSGTGTGGGPLVSLGAHPLYGKFFKLLKVGIPREAVKLKMAAEGADPALLDKDPADMVSEQMPVPNPGPKAAATNSASEEVPVGQHPRYSKYFKMLKMGLPRAAVQLKMQQEGVEASVLDKDPAELVPLLQAAQAPPEDKEKDKEEMVAAGLHPVYSKYFKMLKIGLPLAAVKSKVQQEGHDPAVMDRDPADLIPLAAAAAGDRAGGKGAAAQQLLKVRKKKLYWKALDASKLHGNSLWAQGEGEGDMDNIQFDEDEFNQLFVESMAAQAARPLAGSGRGGTKEAKKQKVVLIDRKRAQNAGIALARIKFPPEDLRAKVLAMDDDSLSTDQLKSMIEFLPTGEEVGLLKGYKGDVELLGQAERYMLVMQDCRTAAKRIRCMIYKQQFKPRYLECRGKIAKVQNACDDVKMSQRLRKVLKYILKVGNQLNDGEAHKGFTVDSLLKLQSAKAFDKKTSVLQYVITLIHRNDEDCLRFPEDLKHVSEAARMSMDTIAAEKSGLLEEFNGNLRILEDIRSAAEDEANNTDAMLDFLVKADGLCKELDKGIDKAKEKFARVLEYFGEDPAMTSQDFFSTLNKFIQEFVSVRDSVQRTMRQLQAQQKQLEQAAAAPKPTAGNPRSAMRRFSTMGPLDVSEALAQMPAAAAAAVSSEAPAVVSTAADSSKHSGKSPAQRPIDQHPAAEAPEEMRKTLTRRKSSYM